MVCQKDRRAAPKLRERGQRSDRHGEPRAIGPSSTRTTHPEFAMVAVAAAAGPKLATDWSGRVCRRQWRHGKGRRRRRRVQKTATAGRQARRATQQLAAEAGGFAYRRGACGKASNGSRRVQARGGGGKKKGGGGGRRRRVAAGGGRRVAGRVIDSWRQKRGTMVVVASASCKNETWERAMERASGRWGGAWCVVRVWWCVEWTGGRRAAAAAAGGGMEGGGGAGGGGGWSSRLVRAWAGAAAGWLAAVLTGPPAHHWAGQC